MIKQPYVRGEKTDVLFRELLIRGVRVATIENDDDFLLLIAGVTGSGKSSLGLYAVEEYDESPSIDFVALSKHRFAQSIYKVKGKPKPRWVDYDEADVIKRDAMSRWNKAIIKLYSKIRGKNIFHIWCHPSVEMLDKHQVQEVVNGLVWIYKKGSPRYYYYFTKKGLLRVLERYGNLKEKSLKSGAGEYAKWRGWFERYDGPLWKEYLSLKEASMDEEIESFYEEWGKGETFSGRELARSLGVHKSTVYRAAEELTGQGLLRDCKNAAGNYRFSGEDKEVIREYLMEKHSRGMTE